MVLAQATLIDKFAGAFEAVGASWVLWLLVVLSVLSVAVMIERAVFFAGHSMGNIDVVAQALKSGDLDGAVRLVASKRGLEAEVVREGVGVAWRGPEAVEETILSVIGQQRLMYERFLSFLGTLGNNAPFIGLFGTVLGIISAFAELAKRASAGTVSTGSGTIMSGISEALVATAVGLLVALPAVAVYNVFQRWLKTITARGEVLGHALASHLKSLPPEPAEVASGPVGLPRAATK
jgi:biopolymer transport protein ExbB